jgi:hypothetical protein
MDSLPAHAMLPLEPTMFLQFIINDMLGEPDQRLAKPPVRPETDNANKSFQGHLLSKTLHIIHSLQSDPLGT